MKLRNVTDIVTIRNMNTPTPSSPIFAVSPAWPRFTTGSTPPSETRHQSADWSTSLGSTP